MQELIQKIIEKINDKHLKTASFYEFDPLGHSKFYLSGLDWAKDAIKKTASEYNNGWVNIKERLPKSYTNVLLYMIVPINDVPTQLIGIGYIDDENYWRYADHFGGFSYYADGFDDEWANDFHSKWITHWQPLPNPPKEQ